MEDESDHSDTSSADSTDSTGTDDEEVTSEETSEEETSDEEATGTDGEETSSEEVPVETEADSEESTGEDIPVETDGLPADEESALKRVRAVSKLLDDAIPVPGTDFRIGIDPLLGIVPVVGDVVAAAISLYPVVEAYRLDISRGTILKMLALVAVDAVVGSVPVLGPVFDAFWKANKWNLGMLEDHLQQG